ncbi:hypothetical protein [Streptomyces sp. NPDC058867]|uniref:hypothetical protein n=1 Tax=unclassified Streptomyces TaxID=2593676 RepID=UPI0036AFEA78
MTTRPSVSRRIAAAVLGAERPGRGRRGATVRRDLPYGRRLLAAVFGVRAGAEAPPRPDSSPEEPLDTINSEEPQPARTRRSPRSSPYALPARAVRQTSQRLLSEDRADYERILDEALNSAPYRPELADVGLRLNTEQLRMMALNATPLISSAAAEEYQHYVDVRERSSQVATSDGTGASTGAVIAVLAPVLAGAAATLFLGFGYLLKLVNLASSFRGGLITTGWVFAAVTAAALLMAAAGLVHSALRNAREAPAEINAEVRQAREEWRTALLEGGIIPFLRDALAGPEAMSAPPRTTPSFGHIPRFGYSRPDFTSPDFGGPGPAVPGFEVPDHEGTERGPE